MKNDRKDTRKWLDLSLKKPFYEVIDEAKLSPTQLKIAKMKFIEHKYNYEIAQILNVSESKIDKEIAKAYDAIRNVLLQL